MTDAARCKRNYWRVGDVLESTVDTGLFRITSKIEITAIGRSAVLAVETWRNGMDIQRPVEALWSLGDRKWRRVG